MFSVSLAAFGFIMFASIFGMPISGTHSIVGALIGAGIAGLGGSAIDYTYMRKVILSWFVSPAVSSSMCFVFIVLVSLLTLNSGGASLKWRLFNTQLVAAFALAISTYMTLILVQKNYRKAGEPIIDTWQYGLMPGAFVIGFLASRWFMAHVLHPAKSFGEKLGFAFKLCSYDEILESESVSGQKAIDLMGERIDPNSGVKMPESKVKGIYIMTEMYRFLMVLAALMVCLAHGSNDVANAITPLLVVQNANSLVNNGVPYQGKSGYWIGSIGIAAGLLILGVKVMETVGKKVIKLNYVVGFCA
jgi:inorganic phosphate transporter, PiT family